jgi:type I restriction enzyme S subunit
MSFSDDINALVRDSADDIHAAAASWVRMPLGKVATIQNGFPFESEYFTDDVGARLIRIRDVTSGDTSTFYRGPVPEGYWVQKGDVVVGMDGDFNLRVWQTDPGLLNQRVCKIVPNTSLLESGFLAFVLPGYLRLINEHTHSVTVKHLSSRTLQQIPLPLPTMAEQRRIVARIDALFARTRRARTDLERIASLSNKYFAATMKKSFEGLLTETWRSEPQVAVTQNRDNGLKGPYELPSGWSWQYLPALGELARGKSRHRPRNAGFLYGGPYPFIQTGDVRAAQGRLRTYEQTYSEAGLAQSKLWPRDTVCITIAANIAETAILDIEACFPDSVVGFKAAQHTCLPEFIEYFIRTAKADLAAFAPATAQKNINLETLEGVLVPTPSLAEQRECVRLLSRSELAADACRREATRALALLDRLEQSILARAFRGELVPQSLPDDRQHPAQAIGPIATGSPRRGRRAAA